MNYIVLSMYIVYVIVIAIKLCISVWQYAAVAVNTIIHVDGEAY